MSPQPAPQFTPPISLWDAFARGLENFGGGMIDMAAVFGTIETIWYVWWFISMVASAAFVYGIIYASVRYNQLAEIETEHLLEQERLFQKAYSGSMKNNRWADVLRHVETDNPNDWKLAIIEADIMLEDMLKEHGYAGTTIGEKLRSASPNSFLTLDDAWQAHRVRNQIAHEGADFVLTHKVARDTIKQFERVFTEFGYV